MDLIFQSGWKAWKKSDLVFFFSFVLKGIHVRHTGLKCDFASFCGKRISCKFSDFFPQCKTIVRRCARAVVCLCLYVALRRTGDLSGVSLCEQPNTTRLWRWDRLTWESCRSTRRSPDGTWGSFRSRFWSGPGSAKETFLVIGPIIETQEQEGRLGGLERTGAAPLRPAASQPC